MYFKKNIKYCKDEIRKFSYRISKDVIKYNKLRHKCKNAMSFILNAKLYNLRKNVRKNFDIQKYIF